MNLNKIYNKMIIHLLILKYLIVTKIPIFKTKLINKINKESKKYQKILQVNNNKFKIIQLNGLMLKIVNKYKQLNFTDI